MAPDPWTAFVFFGIPFVLGLLGLLHSCRLFYRVYRRWVAPDPELVTTDAPTENRLGDSPSRGQLLQYAALFVGSALLVAHSGRWLLQIYGVL